MGLSRTAVIHEHGETSSKVPRCRTSIQPAGSTPCTLQDAMPTETRDQTHIDMFDHNDRQRWAQHFGVTEERLHKAVRMVSSRISSVAAYLGHSAP